MKILAPILLVSLLFTACNSTPEVQDYSKEVDAGKFNENNYSCDEIGWETTFPKQIIITTKESLILADERSKELSETEKNGSSLKRLLAYQYNFDNNFQSTMEKFEGNQEAFDKRVSEIHTQIYDNYLYQRISIDSLGSIQKIGKRTFRCFSLKLYDKKGEISSNQILYNALINGYYCNFVISYTQAEYGEEMKKLFTKSTF